MAPRTTTESPTKRRRARHKPLLVGAEAYAEFSAWRQEHLPWLLEPGGPAIFFRLITAANATPTAELHQDAGASLPRLRKTVDLLRRKGLVTVTIDEKDRRRELVEATDLFRRLARCYAQAMVQILRR